jgi:hypothetical protein
MGTTISNGAVGPQTFPGTTNWFSQLIPCRGAKSVWIRFRSTDANIPAGFNASVFSGATGGAQSVASGTLLYTMRFNNNINMQGTGWICMVDAGAYFGHDYITLVITSHASGHAAFQADVDVMYDGDADDIGSSVGQYRALPL